ncbi:Pml1p Ecym_8262 [Eremothecium cymbalariae DBVPG|uniref:FHA domain-containing protein n=1 Tax=Eremothecium cymbalariae (strain CBS 270.75 / DBVPG 7215 / KCTC 17166 / NRRL Y-17582) TaxID=931890 RepID=G8JXH0_ERECY|nr:Hypothetical protein Ecym_8262 [Eremothecium cymbalariae DBVPG\
MLKRSSDGYRTNWSGRRGNNYKRSRYGDDGRGYRRHAFLPVFEPSGLLSLESNSRNQVALKHVEPSDSVSPEVHYTRWKVPLRRRTRFEALLYRKGSQEGGSGNDEVQERWELSSAASYIIGSTITKSDKSENAAVVTDIGIPEETISEQHAVIQFRERDGGALVPYVIDLNSSNGTLLNGSVIPQARYVELRSGDVLEFSNNSNDTNFELIFMAV